CARWNHGNFDTW
nr:immunoglobulin heavy chain junction region [Macaca mulatta]